MSIYTLPLSYGWKTKKKNQQEKLDMYLQEDKDF